MRAVIAAGGTAGHVNPGLALAHELADADTVFIGALGGPEKDLVGRAELPFETISVRGFDRARPLSMFPTGVVALRAFREARRLLGRLRPRVAVGMGGYVSLPVSLAARTLGIPVVLHEQNIVLGLAHRVCRPWATRVAVSFEETLAEAGHKAVFVGNPVLPELTTADRAAARRAGLKRWRLEAERRTILIFGGSQGARRLNDSAVELGEIWSSRSDVQIVHICGARDISQYEARVPDEQPLVYRLVAFVDRMVEAYSVADLAVSRGGATTVAELTVAGLPALVVPYPHHRDRQQERHGRVLERAGAARVIDDAVATGDRLAREIDSLLNVPADLKAMSVAAKSLGRPDAARRLADVVLEAAA